MVTDHRSLLSILKEKTSKIHQSRLTRWTDRLLPLDFKLENIACSKMRFVDYISRNRDAKLKPVSKYDAEFVVAQIDAICKAVEIFQKKRGRGGPRKNTSQTATSVKRLYKRGPIVMRMHKRVTFATKKS